MLTITRMVSRMLNIVSRSLKIDALFDILLLVNSTFELSSVLKVRHELVVSFVLCT
jgi:hypothetical protein